MVHAGRTLAAIALLLGAWLPMAMAEDANPDAILGKWNDAKKEGVFEIYRDGDRFFGRIAGLKTEVYPPGDPEAGKKKHDRENPDPALRSRDMMGLVFLKDFRFEEDKYVGGTIYNPESGKTYKCKMHVEGDTLHVRGYIGVSFLGKTEHWTRVRD